MRGQREAQASWREVCAEACFIQIFRNLYSVCLTKQGRLNLLLETPFLRDKQGQYQLLGACTSEVVVMRTVVPSCPHVCVGFWADATLYVGQYHDVTWLLSIGDKAVSVSSISRCGFGAGRWCPPHSGRWVR